MVEEDEPEEEEEQEELGPDDPLREITQLIKQLESSQVENLTGGTQGSTPRARR